MNDVRNIAPFINDEFVITSKWWNERINPVTGQTEIHRGLDIATSGSKPVYSMLKGYIHSKGTDNSRGNWVIIKDNNIYSSSYGYATLYMHLAEPCSLSLGTNVEVGEYIGMEGSTGISSGIHLHIEMQDLNRFNNTWHSSYNQSDYIDPTLFMGIDNIEGTHWIYKTLPFIYSNKKQKFKWILYYKKLKKIIKSQN